jgi:hypothetical protein
MSGGAKLNVRVAEVVEVNELITRFRFVSRDGSPLPAFSGGAHTVVEMDDHGTRRLNPYSLMSDPEDTSGYEISVRRDDQGRGGSLFMHRHVKPGMEMVLSYPGQPVRAGQPGEEAPDDRGRHRHHALPGADRAADAFRRQVRAALRRPQPPLGAYMDRLTAAHPDRVHCYFDEEKQMIDLAASWRPSPLARISTSAARRG